MLLRLTLLSSQSMKKRSWPDLAHFGFMGGYPLRRGLCWDSHVVASLGVRVFSFSAASHGYLTQCSHRLKFNIQHSIINIEYSGLLRHSSPGISPQRLVVCLTLEPRARQ